MNKNIHLKNQKSLVESRPRYIPTRTEDNMATGFGEEDENVIVDGRMDGQEDPSYNLKLVAPGDSPATMGAMESQFL